MWELPRHFELERIACECRCWGVWWAILSEQIVVYRRRHSPRIHSPEVGTNIRIISCTLQIRLWIVYNLSIDHHAYSTWESLLEISAQSSLMWQRIRCNEVSNGGNDPRGGCVDSVCCCVSPARKVCLSVSRVSISTLTGRMRTRTRAWIEG